MQSVSSDLELVYLKKLVMRMLRVNAKGSSARSLDGPCVCVQNTRHCAVYADLFGGRLPQTAKKHLQQGVRVRYICSFSPSRTPACPSSHFFSDVRVTPLSFNL